ncbi:hypothetical protein [Clostridium butyricum]|uniref:hypothetical protein n=1 Tax=Clostridium butyricum TaxID=1492 RepID=UPI002ABD3DAD|nr:hypothetical protein [Clostridium butyricum]
MGKQVDSIVFDHVYSDKILDSCITLDFNTQRKYVDEFEVPYKYTVLTSTRKNKELPDSVEISDVHELYKNIDKEDCLPDVGLLDYRDDELGIDLKNVTLREVYKIVLNKKLN